jgi:hypothetical protein
VLRPAAWFDAADLSTISVATGVSEWRDRSGNARHVSQATGANQPTYSEFGFRGRPGITFNGSSHQLNGSASITTGTYTGAFNVFWVAARTDAIGGTVLAERSSALIASSQWVDVSSAYYISSDGLNLSSNHQIGLSDFNSLSSAGGIVSHGHVPGSRDVCWLNGRSLSVTTGTASNITGSTSAFCIGNRLDTSLRFTGQICEVLVTLDTLVAPNRVSMEGYLSWKWGIPLAADHPFANRPPLIGD